MIVIACSSVKMFTSTIGDDIQSFSTIIDGTGDDAGGKNAEEDYDS